MLFRRSIVIAISVWQPALAMAITNEKRIIRVPLVDSSAFIDERAEFAVALRLHLSRYDIAASDVVLPVEEFVESANLSTIEARRMRKSNTDTRNTSVASISGKDTSSLGNGTSIPIGQILFCVDILQLDPGDMASFAGGDARNSNSFPILLEEASTHRKLQSSGQVGDRDALSGRGVLASKDSELTSEAHISEMGFPKSFMRGAGDDLCHELLRRVDSEEKQRMSGTLFPKSPLATYHQCLPFMTIRESLRETDERVLFEILPRPPFTLGQNPAPGLICSSKKIQRGHRVLICT